MKPISPILRNYIDKPKFTALTECSLWSFKPSSNFHISPDYILELSNNIYSDRDWLPRTISREKWPGSEVDYSSPSSADIKKAEAIPQPMSSWLSA
jgi:hypothetical protein